MATLSVQQAFERALGHHRAGQLAAAEQLYRQILNVQPRHAGVLNHLGIIAHQQGHSDAAIAFARKALEVMPDYPEAHDSLGNALKGKGLFEEAIAAYRRAAALMPRSAITRNSLGLALLLSGRLDEAIVAFCEAIGIDPNYPDAYCNLGNALSSRGRLDEAIVAAGKAIALDPQLPQAYGIFGIALRDSGQLQRAADAFRRAIALQPENPDSHLNLAIVLLTLGQFSEGWEEYEWRERCDNYLSMRRSFTQPRWDGSPLRGRRILIHVEQGLGDAIQFSRYLPMLAAMVGCDARTNIIFEVQPDLVGLFQVFADRCAVVTRGDALPPFDVQCPLLSLPWLFKTTIESIPAEVPYLFADHNLMKAWRERIPSRDSKLNVALTWAGNSTFAGDHARSMSLNQLGSLGAVTGVNFFSVQKGYAEQQLSHPPAGLEIIDLAADLDDMSDTAAALSVMDLVITTDTSIAHLAGALGRPVWVMVQFVPDWRWLMNRGDCPWYPSMRLFRQPNLGDWDRVLERVVEALRERVRAAG